MHQWIRHALVLSVGVVIGVGAVAVGLGSASAAPGPGSPTPVPTPATKYRPAGTGEVTFVPKKADAVFVPITPCRVVDTRSTSAGKITAGTARNFRVRGGLSGQGGRATCGIPAAAGAIAASVTVVDAGHGGYLAGYPYGAGNPGTNFVTYSTGSTVSASPTLALSPAGKASDLSIYTNGGSTDVILDVTGYYESQIEGLAVGSNGVNQAFLYSDTSRTTSIRRTSVGVYVLTLDTDVNACAVEVTTTFEDYYTDAETEGTTIQVDVWKIDPATNKPVAADADFNYAVSC